MNSLSRLILLPVGLLGRLWWWLGTVVFSRFGAFCLLSGLLLASLHQASQSLFASQSSASLSLVTLDQRMMNLYRQWHDHSQPPLDRRPVMVIGLDEAELSQAIQFQARAPSEFWSRLIARLGKTPVLLDFPLTLLPSAERTSPLRVTPVPPFRAAVQTDSRSQLSSLSGRLSFNERSSLSQFSQWLQQPQVWQLQQQSPPLVSASWPEWLVKVWPPQLGHIPQWLSSSWSASAAQQRLALLAEPWLGVGNTAYATLPVYVLSGPPNDSSQRRLYTLQQALALPVDQWQQLAGVVITDRSATALELVQLLGGLESGSLIAEPRWQFLLQLGLWLLLSALAVGVSWGKPRLRVLATVLVMVLLGVMQYQAYERGWWLSLTPLLGWFLILLWMASHRRKPPPPLLPDTTPASQPVTELAATLPMEAQDLTAATAANPMANPVPVQLGRYRIEREIGRGASGVVYLGQDPLISRQVAIKCMSYQNLGAQALPELKHRFIREAEAAGRLRHPNIVAVYDVGETETSTYIAMEYVDGVALSERVKTEQLLAVSQVYEIVAQVAEALDYAHQNNIVHRDIKPANILWDEDTHRALVSDFGIARIADQSRTRTGEIMGSPLYMAPEQLKGHKVGPAADIFSLGVTFYQLLTGEVPFDSEQLATLSYQIIHDKHRPIRKWRPELTASATRIVNCALQKDPQKRYTTAGAMAEALRNSLRRDFKKSDMKKPAKKQASSV
ncbi:serine/threonine protein kinase [Aestuariicella hydrocarbonica]|uniref:non-specific serine/threonine protein kinase n=1 Tax=Pseudomaricurvus hydrocarbonicus TaxID=1470433 RepID=A0A9E5MQC3_9GAMM|nr:serine/threonine-protein kinase [Aestuariicella hydrocarbonica]NHO68486.1 serine/threonine protein kinase [Aestuariicella hydrocarbonica]